MNDLIQELAAAICQADVQGVVDAKKGGNGHHSPDHLSRAAKALG